MKAYSLDPALKELKEIDIEIQANTVYSFFNSILIDESLNLNKHVIYSDANAINENKTPFFLGGQILVGNLLILGRDDFEDTERTISQADLELLIDYEVNPFYTEVLTLLSKTEINLYKTFEVDKQGEKIALNCEWVLYTFNIADEKTQEYFISELKKALESGVKIESHIQKMAQLAINAIR